MGGGEEGKGSGDEWGRGVEWRGDELHSAVSTATNNNNVPAKYACPPTRFMFSWQF